MTYEEYQDKLKEIDKKANKEKDAIHIQYADYNNPYKIGDIIEDYYQIIKIESINYHMSSNALRCKYKGVRLTKKLKPFKNGASSTMYQVNVAKKHS